MSKKRKDVTDDTIFSEELGVGYRCPADIKARRLGVLFVHDVNPNVVNARGIRVTRIGTDTVQVDYSRIVLAPDESDWSPSTNGGARVPRGVPCAGGDGLHMQSYAGSFVATWAEVSL